MAIIAANHEQAFFKPGLSATSINDFFKSPAHFWKNSSLNPQRERKEASPAMIFGRAIHHLILTPELFEKDFVIEPEKPQDALVTSDDLKQALANIGVTLKAPKKADLILAVRQHLPGAPIWDDMLYNFETTKGKRDSLTREEYNKAIGMRDAMFANKAVRQLIGNGMSEAPVCWWKTPQDQGGVMWKSKLDYARAGLVIEYKTTESANREELSKSIATFGYHRQLAIEVEAYEILNGERPKGALIIAQEKDCLDNIAIYPLSVEAIQQGRREVDYAENEILARLKQGYWKSFEEKILEPIGLPRWYDYKDAAQKAQAAA